MGSIPTPKGDIFGFFEEWQLGFVKIVSSMGTHNLHFQGVQPMFWGLKTFIFLWFLSPKDTITGIFQEGVSNFCYTPGFTLERRWLVIVTHAKILRKWIRGSWTCNGLGVKIANICPALVWPPAHVVWCEETVAPDLQRRLVLDSYLEMVTAQGCSRWAQRVFLALIELAPFLKSDKEPDQEHLLPWVVLPAARFGTGMPVRSPPILDLKPSALDDI